MATQAAACVVAVVAAVAGLILAVRNPLDPMYMLIMTAANMALSLMALLTAMLTYQRDTKAHAGLDARLALLEAVAVATHAEEQARQKLQAATGERALRMDAAGALGSPGNCNGHTEAARVPTDGTVPPRPAPRSPSPPEGASSSNAKVLFFKCPEGVRAGDALSVTGPDGESVEIVVPAGTSPGDEVEVLVQPKATEEEETRGSADELAPALNGALLRTPKNTGGSSTRQRKNFRGGTPREGTPARNSPSSASWARLHGQDAGANADPTTSLRKLQRQAVSTVVAAFSKAGAIGLEFNPVTRPVTILRVVPGSEAAHQAQLVPGLRLIAIGGGAARDQTLVGVKTMKYNMLMRLIRQAPRPLVLVFTPALVVHKECI